MHLEKALEQISEIHAQVLKAEVFRGYRAVTMLVTAAIAVVAAALQPSLMEVTTPLAFVLYWAVVAGFSAAICAFDMYRSAHVTAQRGQRWRTLLVVSQSVPALLVGAVATAILIQRPGYGAALPGLWAMFFALGIWSSRPYLPRAIGVVALFYLMAGTWQMSQMESGVMPSPWGMGLTFGVGQVAVAMVLYLNLERPLQIPAVMGGQRRG